MRLCIPKRRSKVLPGLVLTPEDWIADVLAVYEDGTQEELAIGVSHWLSESDAVRRVNATLAYKQVRMADVRMRRRWQRNASVVPDDPERAAIFTKELAC